jgi:hypothetical protein
VARGSSDGGGARVAARVWFGAKLMWGGMGEVHRMLYRGVGGVRIKIRVKDKIRVYFEK